MMIITFGIVDALYESLQSRYMKNQTFKVFECFTDVIARASDVFVIDPTTVEEDLFAFFYDVEN